jgi:hypothetical protein
VRVEGEGFAEMREECVTEDVGWKEKEKERIYLGGRTEKLRLA